MTTTLRQVQYRMRAGGCMTLPAMQYRLRAARHQGYHRIDGYEAIDHWGIVVLDAYGNPHDDILRAESYATYQAAVMYFLDLPRREQVRALRRRKNKKLKRMPCPVCGVFFSQKDYRQKSCGHACGAKMRRERERREERAEWERGRAA